MTIVQRRTPAELIGRVSAAADTLITGPQAVSIGVGALLVSIVDYRLLFALMAVGMTAAAGYLWVGRSLSAPGPAIPADENAIEPTPVPSLGAVSSVDARADLG